VKYFFSTSEIPEYPFVLFGWSHLLLILWVVLFGFIVIRMAMKGDDKRKQRLRWFLMILFLVWEIEWQVWHIITDTWTAQEHLPLHMCSIMVWVSMYGLWSGKRWVFNLMYFFGIAGAIQAIITPDAHYAFPHFRFMNTLFSHSLLVISGFWVVFIEGFRPTSRDLKNAFIVVNVYSIPVYLVNLAVGSHYLYLGAKPETASLMDYFPEWPFYYPLLVGILGLIMLAMYLPFARKPKPVPG